MAKNRIELRPDTDIDAILGKVKAMYAGQSEVNVNDIDGVKIDFTDRWVHLRRSNTEPIIRVYSEAHTLQEAEEIGQQIVDIVQEML